MRRGLTVAATGVLLALIGTGCGGAQTKEPSAAQPFPVQLALDVPSDLKIGVVLSLTSGPGEGADWSGAAEGARVAQYRFERGGADVTLVPLDDKGTAAGAKAAVQELVTQGVSGVVMATEGAHLKAAIAEAGRSGLPMLLPYDGTAGDLPANVWRTGPADSVLDQRLLEAMDSAGVAHPVLIDVGGGVPEGLTPTETFAVSEGGNYLRPARRIKAMVRRGSGTDAVVVSGSALAQAKAVRELQGLDIHLPIYLTGDALSPAFAAGLTEDGGSLADDLNSVGENTGDVAALAQGASGRSLSAFFLALNSATESGKVTDFFDASPFGTVADVADVRSHDAVVSLVAAAARAESTDRAKVADALGSLQVTHADGAAGPALDFSQNDALTQDDVVSLSGTDQDPGLRPDTASDAAHLFWFATATTK